MSAIVLIILFVFAAALRRAYQLGGRNERRKHFSATLRPDDSTRQRL